MEILTADEVLELVRKRAQWCRENSESDMRNILNFVSLIKTLINEGRSREEVLSYMEDYFLDDE